MNTFKRKALFAAVLAGLAVSGCADIPKAPDMKSTVEGVRASANVKDANAGCFKASGPLNAWSVLMTWINADSGVVDGDLNVGADCSITHSNRTAPPINIGDKVQAP